MSICKRSCMLLLVVWITFSSVFFAYQDTCECADFVAGVVATVGGAPLLTALLVGGVVVAGGVAIYELSQTDAQDWANFGNGIKEGFEQFVGEQEKQIALEKDQSLSDQQAADIGVQVAREKVNEFWDSTVTGVTNTTKAIKFDAYKYWELYSKIIGEVADEGINENIDQGELGDNDVVRPRLWNLTDYDITTAPNTNIGKNCLLYDGNYYVYKGDYTTSIDQSGVSTEEHDFMQGVSQDYIRIPFGMIYMDGNIINHRACQVMINKNTGEVSQVSSYTGGASYTVGGTVNSIGLAISGFTIPVIIGANYNTIVTYVREHWKEGLSVSTGGTSVSVPEWKRTINNVLDNTKAGKSIQTGRRTLVNNGDHIIGVFQEDSVPIKKSTIASNEGVISGDIGWDIPAGGVYDDVYVGGRPYSDVVDDTGTISVPDDVIIGANDPDKPIDNDTSVSFPDDSTVQDSADYPKDRPDENTRPEELPDKPIKDVIEEQGGTFYPTEMTIKDIFPFCIPFDIIAIVEKFDVGGENAPKIEIPIVYPQKIASILGSESYIVEIDFQDYVVLRNILRVFLLLLFMVGLMQLTRNIIRG